MMISHTYKERINIMFQTYNNSPSAIKPGSPLMLTEIGKDISETIDAKAIMEKYYSPLKDEVMRMSPKDAYDYQQMSVFVAESKLLGLLSDQELHEVKGQALKHGTPLTNVLSVVALLLIDRLLEESNHFLSDVGKYAPSEGG